MNNKGLSLIESFLVALILTALLAMTTQFFIQSSQVWQAVTSESDLRHSARNAIESISKDIRSSTRTSSVTPSPNLSIPAKPNNFNLTFYLPQDLDGNNLIINSIGNTEWNTTAGAEIKYQYNPYQNTLERVQGVNTTVIARDVTGVEFEDRNINNALYNDEFRVVLTLSNTTPSKRVITITLSSIIKFRNR